LSGYGAELPTRVADALAAAEIPPSKLGAARQARLHDSERELYFWILRRFATHGRPTGAEMVAAGESLGLDAQEAVETLAREDLVHLGEDGEVAVAYPFSGRPTAHKVRFENGHQAHAMCAIDALGIAAMFDQPIEIISTDPLAGDDVRAQLTAQGEGTWEPASAVVVAGVSERSDDSFRGCCPVLNFFASSKNGERWLEQHSSVRGQVVAMPEAIAAGRAVFGDVFR
jgi:alkylmercury lyase-like protein